MNLPASWKVRHNLAPQSDMGRDCWTQQCTHAWTPILAAAIQKRDVRVGQGGTLPAYISVLLPQLTFGLYHSI